MTQATMTCSVDLQDYKQAMRYLGGAPCVITAESQGQRGGLTATSVVSVSVDPPEVMVSINQSSSAWPLIEKSGCFGVNILNTEQQHVAAQFAGMGGLKGAQRYGNDDWFQHNGVWLLDQAPVALACQVSEVILRHSHALVFGEVQFVQQGAKAPIDSPLLYWHGEFGTFCAG